MPRKATKKKDEEKDESPSSSSSSNNRVIRSKLMVGEINQSKNIKPRALLPNEKKMFSVYTKYYQDMMGLSMDSSEFEVLSSTIAIFKFTKEDKKNDEKNSDIFVSFGRDAYFLQKLNNLEALVHPVELDKSIDDKKLVGIEEIKLKSPKFSNVRQNALDFDEKKTLKTFPMIEFPITNMFVACFQTILKDLHIPIVLFEYDIHSKTYGTACLSLPGKIHERMGEYISIGDRETVQVTVFYRGTLERTNVGLCFTNKTERQIQYCQFHDDSHFSTLETILNQIASEVCVIQKFVEKKYDEKKKKDIAETLGETPELTQRNTLLDVLRKTHHQTIQEVPAKDFDDSNLDEDLQKLLRKEQIQVLIKDIGAEARKAIAAEIKSMELIVDGEKSYDLDTFKHDAFLRLDASAFRALNLLPETTEEEKKQSNLFGLLNQTKTKMGERLLKKWIRQPLVDIEEITRRHQMVSALVDSQIRSSVRDHLKQLPDFEAILLKMQKVGIKLQDIVDVFESVENIKNLVEELQTLLGDSSMQDQEKETFKEFLEKIDQFCGDDCLGNFLKLREYIVRDPTVETKDKYIIAPHCDPEMLRLYNSKLFFYERKIKKNLESLKDDIANVLEIDSYKASLAYDEKVGHHVVISFKKKKADAPKKTLEDQGAIILAKKAQRLLVATQKIVYYNQKYLELDEKFEECHHMIFLKLVKSFCSYFPIINILSGLLGELDVLATFAEVSSANSYIMPTMKPQKVATKVGNGWKFEGETMELHLEKSRHPILEKKMGANGFIPNDVHMVEGQSHMLIITGPNMGGKSIYIKQIGVIVLMAQIGCFVPAEKAIITVRDGIYARVGASDYQSRGVSTFLAEMLETAVIIQRATPNSLVVIDELGRGTSTVDGYAIATAISMSLATRKTFTLFATHFHELTNLNSLQQAKSAGGFANYHVAHTEGDNAGEIKMKYEVLSGPASNSFGLHVARIAKFPLDVIAFAEAIIDELNALKTKKRKRTGETEGIGSSAQQNEENPKELDEESERKKRKIENETEKMLDVFGKRVATQQFEFPENPDDIFKGIDEFMDVVAEVDKTGSKGDE